MLVRIEELEQQLSALRGRLAELEAQRNGDQSARPLPPAVPESKPRFDRAGMEPAEGARLVARHMLSTGTPAENVAAHLEETFDLADAEIVVEQVARLRFAPLGTEPGRQMSENQIETDQAAREASGARPYGRYLEDFEVGAVYKHWPAKTVTEADDHLFCLITMNHHPLHINDVYASQSQQGRNVVVGPLVYSLALGMSVADVSGKAIANLATEDLRTRPLSSTGTPCSQRARCST